MTYQKKQTKNKTGPKGPRTERTCVSIRLDNDLVPFMREHRTEFINELVRSYKEKYEAAYGDVFTLKCRK